MPRMKLDLREYRRIVDEIARVYCLCPSYYDKEMYILAHLCPIHGDEEFRFPMFKEKKDD